MATTHSPVFIDLSKDHTTIIRVDKDSQNKYISTNDIGFDKDEKVNLKIVRACNPMVNEFFSIIKLFLWRALLKNCTESSSGYSEDRDACNRLSW